MPEVTVKHALGVVTHERYKEEKITRVTPDELSVDSNFNARIQLEPQSEDRFSADFLVKLGRMYMTDSMRKLIFEFYDLEGKPLDEYRYDMSDSGLLITTSKKELGYVLGANRDVDRFIKSILDLADVQLTETEESELLVAA